MSGQGWGARWVSEGSLGMEHESDCSKVKDHSLESHRQTENKSLVRLTKLRDRPQEQWNITVQTQSDNAEARDNVDALAESNTFPAHRGS